MGPRAALPHPHEYPWKASALISAFTQLILTLLVLVHTVFVCITFQLMKWSGRGLPCWNGTHRSGASPSFDPCVNNKPSKPASYAYRDSPLISTERSLKRSRSEDWCFSDSKPLVCPTCHGVWSFKPDPSFKDDRGAAFQWRETSTCLDEGDSSAVRCSYVEAGVRSWRSNYTCRINKAHGDADKLARANSFLETTVSAEEYVDKAETPVDSNKRMQTRVDSDKTMQAPVKRSQLLLDEEADGKTGKAEARKDFSAEAEDEGKEFPLLEQVLLEGVGSETPSEASRLTCRVGCSVIPHSPLEEVQYETGFDNEEFSVATKENHDGEGVIRGLEEALQMARKKLCTLYAELEVERIASETAANEAMAMISRLQEEKAALDMEAAHYQRMAEEKAIYDEQAMQLLKEILYEKERENFLLEKEVKVIKTRFRREVQKVSKRTKGAESTPFFLEDEPMVLLKDVDEVLNSEEQQGLRMGTQGVETDIGVSSMERSRSSAKPPCISQTTEEQPSKRLKGIPAHENGTNQTLLLASDTPNVQHRPDIALIGYDEKTLNHTVDSEYGSQDSVSPEQHKQPEKIAQLSVSATNEADTNAALNSSRALEAHLQEQAKTEELDFEGTDQLSQSGRESDAMKPDVYVSGDRDKLLVDSLPLGLVLSLFSERKCTLESHHFSADERGNQDLCTQSSHKAQISSLHDFCEVSGLEQSGIFLHKEGLNICSPCSSNETMVRANSGTVSGNPLQVPCSSPSNCLVMNSQGTPHQAVAECLQCSFHDMELVLGDRSASKAGGS